MVWLVDRFKRYLAENWPSLGVKYRSGCYIPKPPNTLTVHYDEQLLKTVTAQALTVTAIDGSVHTLVFAICAEKWAQHHGITVSKCIGDREVLSRPLYMQFYGEPPIRLEFRDYGECSTFRFRLERLGWFTADMT